MESQAPYFDRYFIVGQDVRLTAQIKSIILKDRNYISPVINSLSALFTSHMENTYDRTLVLVDFSAMTVEDLLKLLSSDQSSSDGELNLSVAFFNVSKSALAFPFLSISGLCGLFQRDIDDALLAQGISVINRGALWFSQDLLSEVTGRVLIDTNKHTAGSIPLTERERELLRYMAVGTSEKEIADNTHVDSSTVKKQVGDIYTKLTLNHHTTAIRIAGYLATQESSLPEWEAIEAV